jgi:hypothetical protein
MTRIGGNHSIAGPAAAQAATRAASRAAGGTNTKGRVETLPFFVVTCPGYFFVSSFFFSSFFFSSFFFASFFFASFFSISFSAASTGALTESANSAANTAASSFFISFPPEQVWCRFFSAGETGGRSIEQD